MKTRLDRRGPSPRKKITSRPTPGDSLRRHRLCWRSPRIEFLEPRLALSAPGFIITPAANLVTTRAQGITTFSVDLSIQPASNVFVDLASSNTSEGTVSTSQLTFTPSNYNQPQTAIVTGAADGTPHQDVPYNVVVSPGAGSDSQYVNLPSTNVSVMNEDGGAAGTPILGYAQSFSSTAQEWVTSTTTDSSGNVYVGGYYTSATMTIGSFPLTSNSGTSAFVAKLNSAGTVLWAESLGGNAVAQANGVAVAADGSVYVAGSFSGSGTFGSTPLTASGTDDVFVAKLNASGSVLWAEHIGASGTTDTATAIATDSSGNVYLTGSFSGTVNFNPSGTTDLTSAGATDAFIAEYSSSSGWTLDWARQLGTSGAAAGSAIALVPGGGVVFTGSFAGTGTFGTTNLTASQDATDVFIAKLNGSGTPTWASDLGETNSADQATSIAVGSDGSVYTGGFFFGSITFPNGSGVPTITSAGLDDGFITKQDSNGNFLWAQDMGGKDSDEVLGIALGPDNSVSATGYFGGTATFGTTNLTTSGVSAIFDTKFDASGNFLWVRQMGGGTDVNAKDLGTAIALGPDGSVYTAGNFNDTINADPNAGTFNLQTGSDTDHALDNVLLSKFQTEAGFIISPTTLTTTQAGGTAAFTVDLATPPTGNVTLGLSSSNITSAGTVSTSSLTFTPTNWYTPQTVTVTGVNDHVAHSSPIGYSIVFGAPTSSDPNYSSTYLAAPTSISASNTNTDTAGFTISPTSGLTTSQAGGTATFTVDLDTIPAGNVTLGLSSSNPTSAGTVSTSSLTFTPSTWNTPQTVTVTGVNDHVVHASPVGYSIVFVAPNSTDPNYNSTNLAAPASISASNTNTDVAGFTISPTSLTTTQAGGTTTFTVDLDTIPTGNVTLGLSSSNPTSAGTVSTSSLTFTPSTWNTPQTVTVTGVNDHVAHTSPIGYSISFLSPNSSDSNYNSPNLAAPASISASNTNTDTAGLAISPTTTLDTSQAGGMANFTVALDTIPSGNVTVGIASSNTNAGTVSTSSLTFTPTNWNTPQTVSVRGVDDHVARSSNVNYTVVATPSSVGGDPLYNALSPSDVSVVNIETDTAGFTFSPSAPVLQTSQAGGTASFTIDLDSLPSGNVTLGLYSSNTNAGTVSAPSLIFTPANWNTPQTVTVTGVNDHVIHNPPVSYSIDFDAPTSSDPNYNGAATTPANIPATNANEPGFTISPTALTTTQAGGTAAFTVDLNTAPSSNVTLGLSSSNATSAGTVSTSSLTFTPSNWNTPQTVTVTGVNDHMVHSAPIGYSIVFAAPSSSDPNYNGAADTPASISASNTITDVAGFTVSPTSGLSTNQAGGTATFTVVLNTIPASNVSIGLTSGNTAQGTVSTASLSFTPATWNTPQTVTVTGQDDFIARPGSGVSYIVVVSAGAAASGDPKYDNLASQNVDIFNSNRDIAGIIVSPQVGLITTAAGGTATFGVYLTSEPTANVTIGLSPSNARDGTVSPTSLTFTAANWNVTQNVTITGHNDPSTNNSVPYNIITAPAQSGDPNYKNVNPADVSVTNTGNHMGGADTIGLFNPATSAFYLKYSNSAGPADNAFNYGPANVGWVPLVGDWNGEGADTVGLYNPATSIFYLKYSNSAGPADLTFAYGPPDPGYNGTTNVGWTPIVGDWNGDGTDTVGLYNPATGIFYLKNSNSAGPADITFAYGPGSLGWKPLTGDWNGDSLVTLGLYAPSGGGFYLKNSLAGGAADITFSYGPGGTGWRPLSGDWNGTGTDTVGLYFASASQSTFFLKNSNSAGAADTMVNYGPPNTTWVPLDGDWSTVGVPQLATGGPAAPAAVGPALSYSQLQPIVTQAIARWAAAGAPQSALQAMGSAQVVIANLPPDYLGAEHDATITISPNAAGYGWFVDPTPQQDQEFVPQQPGNDLRAVNPQAVDRIDLLTVVEHELGHVAGIGDLSNSLDDLMSTDLAVGTRRIPQAADVDLLFSGGGWPGD
jgi:hypothetical protein